MADYGSFFRRQWSVLQQADLYAPHPNLTFHNPAFGAVGLRVLIVRLSPFRDVDRSTPHLVLFQAVRRALRDAYIDLAFFPPRHDRERLGMGGVPWLTGVQSLHSAEDFDVVLISNAYTLELVNLPCLLLRSGIPLMASQRGEAWPPLILGGSNAMATQAIVTASGDSLVDALFFGEGEEQVGELVRCLDRGAGEDKRAWLKRAADQVEGLWVAGGWPEKPVQKAMVSAPGADHLLTDYPLLVSAEAQTARLQISFGCPAFCAFCFEGYDRKPYREVPLAAILETARQVKRVQGNRTLELYSFNFNAHADILALLLELNRLFDQVGLKSQRVDLLGDAPALLEAEVVGGKRQFTLGMEGISARQRAWLHKSLSTNAIVGVLERLFRHRIRQIKMFYILTGHENEDDLAEFSGFVRQLKAMRRRHHPGIRVTFSFGQLVRMPFTPLRHDRLFLDLHDWRRIIGPVKSACETNGFEFRMAMDWDDYCTAQVLAMGGYWLHEPLVEMARLGHCYDEHLSRGYWEALHAWMAAHGRWTPAFLGEKEAHYPFALAFVQSNVSSAFLYRQYCQARAGIDEGYCLGSDAEPGHCLGCGACQGEAQRGTLTGHTMHLPHDGRYLTHLQEMMRAKRQLEPVYVRLRLPEVVAGTGREWVNAWVLRELLAARPALAESLLSAQESLFTVGENGRRYAGLYGDTVFALRAWDREALVSTLTADASGPGSLAEALLSRSGSAPACPSAQVPIGGGGRGLEVVSIAEGFEPGHFRRARLSLTLPAAEFPAAGQRLLAFLRASYVACNVRHWGEGYRLDLSARALKKRVLFEGMYEQTADHFVADLVVSPKFDLLGYLRSFEGPDRGRQARVAVSELVW